MEYRNEASGTTCPSMLWKLILPSRLWASLVAKMVKNRRAVQKAGVWSLGCKDLLTKGMATYSSILAWGVPWTEEPGRLLSMALPKVGYDWATDLSETLDFLCRLQVGVVFVRQPLWSSPFMLRTAVCMSQDQIMVLQTADMYLIDFHFQRFQLIVWWVIVLFLENDFKRKPAYLLLHIKKQDFPRHKNSYGLCRTYHVTGAVSSVSLVASWILTIICKAGICGLIL